MPAVQDLDTAPMACFLSFLTVELSTLVAARGPHLALCLAFQVAIVAEGRGFWAVGKTKLIDCICCQASVSSLLTADAAQPGIMQIL